LLYNDCISIPLDISVIGYLLKGIQKKRLFSQLRKAGICLVKQGSMLWGFGLTQPATVIL
jgi:hypothetical protein